MKKNIGIGVLFILLALSVLASGLGYTSGIGIGKIIISFALLWIFVTSLLNVRFGGIFIPVALALILYAPELGLENINNWAIIGGGVLLTIGFSTIFRRRPHYYYWTNVDGNSRGYSGHGYNRFGRMKDDIHNARAHQNDKQPYENYHEHHGNQYEDYVKEPIEEDNITYRSSFSSSTRFVKSDNLQSARFENELGELKIYLDQVELSDSGAKIDVHCRLGNLILYIPKEFYLVNKIGVTLGNASDSVYYDAANKDQDNTITLTGEVILGNVDIVRI